MIPKSTSIVFRPELTALFQEYFTTRNALKFVADRVAPLFPTPEQSGEYPIFNREGLVKLNSTRRNSDGGYNRIKGDFGQGTFKTEEAGLEYPIFERNKNKYKRMFDAERAATIILQQNLLMDRETKAAAIFTGASLTNHNVSVAWSTTASGVPLTDIETGINAICDNCGCMPSDISLIIPRADFSEMLKTAQIVDKMKYTYPGVQPSLVSPAVVAAMLGIKEVIVCWSAKDSTVEGETISMAQIWTAGVLYLAVLCAPGDPLEIPSTSRTIQWTGDGGADFPIMESYRDDTKRADIVRSRQETDEVLTAEADLMTYQITNT